MDSARDRAESVLAHRFELGQISFTLGGLIAAAVTLVLVWLLARALRRAFAGYASRRESSSRSGIYTVSRIAGYALLGAGGMLALSFLGIPMSRLAVVAGAIGVGVGFGLQAIVSNFICGIILLFDRSLRVGDFVELESGLHGEVRDINMRYTLISTNDNIDILVPNTEFVTGRVVNWTHGEHSRRLRIPFAVAYGSDKELVKRAALEAATEVPFTLALDGPRGPQVWLVDFAESSLGFELVVWLTADATKRPSTVKAGYLWALESALRQHGVEVPYPQRDLHLRSLFGLQGEAALEALHGGEVTADADSERAPRAVRISRPERARLARNDAAEDVDRALREEAARKAEEEAAEPELAESREDGGAARG